MKSMKTVLGSLLITLALTGVAFADQIGVVDIQAVAQKYNKQQDFTTQAKNKEADLAKLQDSLKGQLESGEKLSPVEKKNLQDKLTAQFSAKVKEYRDWAVPQQQAIQANFEKAVQTVAQAQKIDIVLPKQTVLNGGKDITDDVVNTLNK